MKVINLYGGPGIGKSATAAGLFYEMKKRSLNVELISEYAKELTWEDRLPVLKDQLYVMSKQHRKIKILENKVDWVISDSPLILPICYRSNDYFESFDSLVLEVFNYYNNFNFVLSREFDYQNIGRKETEKEAMILDKKIINLLNDKNINYISVDNNGTSTIEKILESLNV